MVSISFNGYENAFSSTYNAASNMYTLTGSSTTSSQSGSITIKPADGYSIVVSAGIVEMSAVLAYALDQPVEIAAMDDGSYSVSFQGLTGSDTIDFFVAVNNSDGAAVAYMQVSQTVTYNPPSDSGGGGGGSDDPPAEIINVINEDNPENLSNDTILTSNHTTEKGDTSTTKVSSAEADALIDLAEQHAEDIDIEEGDHEAVIKVESQGNEGIDTYVVVIAAKDEQKIEESIIDVLSIATPAGDFRIRTEELAEQTDSKPAEFKVTLTRAEHEGRAAVEVKLELAKENIQQFEEQYNVEIRIPYTPAEDEDVNGLIVEYVATDGETFTITESHYDADKGMLCFFAPHLSKYGVAYNPKFFSDVKTTHWASGYITFLASRGIISGMGNGKFQPDAKVTKAQFITMMTNAFSKANIGQKAIKSYKDVKT
ncbi:MAG: S-layer homology domain-containing protein, partial [Anaerovoracaceae bacterium]